MTTNIDTRDDAPPVLDYQAGFLSLYQPLSWMQGHPRLMKYLGCGLADIANDLIAKAYPDLVPAINATAAARRARGDGRSLHRPLSERDHFGEVESELIGSRWTRAEADALILLIEQGAACYPSPSPARG